MNGPLLSHRIFISFTIVTNQENSLIQIGIPNIGCPKSQFAKSLLERVVPSFVVCPMSIDVNNIGLVEELFVGYLHESVCIVSVWSHRDECDRTDVISLFDCLKADGLLSVGFK